MSKKILFITLIVILIAQFSFADGFNTNNGEETESKSSSFISKLMSYMLSFEQDPQTEDSQDIPDMGEKESHRRGHRIKRKVEDDKKGINNNHS